MLRRVVLVRTYVSENVALCSSETSVLTNATLLNIPEDGILQITHLVLLPPCYDGHIPKILYGTNRCTVFKFLWMASETADQGATRLRISWPAYFVSDVSYRTRECTVLHLVPPEMITQ
jgi:hypothetical protein